MLRSVALGAGAAGMVGFWAHGFLDAERAARTEPTREGAPRRTFDAATWRTFEAAADQLLPRDAWGPGARDVNAVGYTDAALADPTVRPAVRTQLLEGLATLDRMARRQGRRPFASLPGARRDRVLTTFEQTPAGLAWMRQAISFVLEALLGDPLHGGNPNALGWTWGQVAELKPRPETPGWRPRGR
ncbi:MAG: gluconate 2-dehydrogenase subunit 3 family protein [Planctomycetota bacterium]|nr:gluconate 2-dehydrogenase subunit 3 family protein [Planctomycetota bacterium]